MNITLNSKVFSKALANVFKAIPKKTATPILQMFYLEVEGDSLKVVGSNGEITIIERISVLNKGQNDRAVVGENLFNYLKSLPDCDVTLETSEKSCTVSFKSGNSQIPCYPPEDYPTIKCDTAGIPSFEVAGKDLLQGINHTIGFCSTDELRPVMGGILFDFLGGHANVVSTNSHSLSIYPIDIKSGDGNHQSIVVPRTTAEIVKNYLGDNDVKIYASDTNCIFMLDNSIVVSRIIIGKFPDYNRVIPNNNPNKLSATKAEYLDTFNRVSTCCNKMSGLMKLSLGLMECTVEGQDLGFNVAARESPEGFKFDGADTKIGFKCDNLIRTISVINADEIDIYISAPNRAALIVAKDPTKDASKIVIMPIVIN